ncbi:MAG: DNA gyrase inhibitor YacG [Deltaproteobacteria bacterium]|nr:DNA gyrase inhibitor YacG [Deltaproteobacteria bacterium]
MKTKLCLICKKKEVKKGEGHWPFCSARCKLIDLGKWASGGYAIAGEPVQKEDEEDDAVKPPHS